MRYLFYNKISEDKAIVRLIYMIEPPLTMLQGGNFVNINSLDLPILPELLDDKKYELYVNPITSECWYEYTNVNPIIDVEMKSISPELLLEIESVKKAARKLIRVDELSKEDLKELINIYPSWEIDLNVKVGEYYRYKNQLYEVIQVHTTQFDWTPNQVPALFNKVEPKGVIPEWVQPTGGHDVYNIGDKVIFNGVVYTSTINANSWSPTAYPAGWSS